MNQIDPVVAAAVTTRGARRSVDGRPRPRGYRPPEWWAEYRRVRRLIGEIPHGTHQGYANWGCRCTECREGHRIQVAEWRARK
jgi:hypothetical protein